MSKYTTAKIPQTGGGGIWQVCGNTSIFYEDFGPSILSLSLTLNVEPCRRSRLKRSGSGEPVNAYDVFNLGREYLMFKT